jgi:DNA helicase-2/ATP-dependent DNA helicase PcrA
MQEQRLINDKKFLDAYDKLNEVQKQAVNHIEGSVLVLAGPGTGKTQLLSLRVCNILRQQDVSPKNILCLTYTDAGASAMRTRLAHFMGADAYKVNIHTFHAFASRIINENPLIFNEYRELSISDDLERNEVLVEMIDRMPLNHPLKRNTGNRYYDISDYEYVFDTMKRENWSPQQVIDAWNELDTYLPLQGGRFVYKRKNNEPNYTEINKEKERSSFVKDAAPLINEYNSLMRAKGLIDYADAIRMVLDKFERNIDLLADYQEQFLYILVDEYQDTNGAQNEIISLICSQDDKPNLFVVGDDDQSIFRFQGASNFNIINFYIKYKPEVFILVNNYRSHQDILNASTAMIERNTSRLIAQIPGLKKELIQSADITKLESNYPRLLTYENEYAQSIGLINEIKELYDKGIPYNDIAVIYKKHSHAEDIISYFNIKKIPYRTKKMVNALEQLLVKKILNIYEYAVSESEFMNSKVNLLFEIMHYDFFKLSPIDIGLFTIKWQGFKQSDSESWREILFREDTLKAIGVKDTQAFLRFHSIMENLISNVKNDTPQVFYQHILEQTSLLDFIIRGENASWNVQLINKIFDYIKNSTSHNPHLTSQQILEKFHKMIENNIPISITNITAPSDGVNFLSAHGSKGLEFRYVFVLNVTGQGWSIKGRNQRKFPINLLELSENNEKEEELRRLMFVTITRAREQVTLLAPLRDKDEKDTTESHFITELDIPDSHRYMMKVEESEVVDYVNNLARLNPISPVLIDKSLIDEFISKMKLNTTAVSKYLRCQKEFYFENILCVPGARVAITGFGNAMHRALDQLVKEMQANQNHDLPSVENLIMMFESAIARFRSHFNDSEYKSYTYAGKTYIENSYNKLIIKLRNAQKIESEYRIETVLDDEIPLTGNIDRIDIYDDHIEVIDYKTGSQRNEKHYAYKSEKDLGGEYWRQGIFYKILLDLQDDKRMPTAPRSSTFIYFKNSDNEYEEKVQHFTDEDIEIVKDQIRAVYRGIKNYQFDQGCNQCHWCEFVNETMGLDLNKVYLEDEKSDSADIEIENEYDSDL